MHLGQTHVQGPFVAGLPEHMVAQATETWRGPMAAHPHMAAPTPRTLPSVCQGNQDHFATQPRVRLARIQETGPPHKLNTYARTPGQPGPPRNDPIAKHVHD